MAAKKTFCWQDPSAGHEEYPYFHSLMMISLREKKIQYVLSDEQVNARRIPAPAVPAALRANATEAMRLAKITHDRNYQLDLDKSKQKDSDIQGDFGSAVASILTLIDPACNCYQEIVNIIDLHVDSDRDQLRAITAHLESTYKPNKAKDAIIYRQEITALRDLDGRGLTTYIADFKRIIAALTSMNKAPTKDEICSWITEGISNPHLQEKKNDYILSASAIPAGPITWEIFLKSCLDLVSQVPKYNNPLNPTIKVNAATVSEPGKKKCAKCSRHNHSASTCKETKCAACNEQLVLGVYHYCTARPPSVGAPNPGRGRGHGDRGRGSAGYGGHRGGRGGGRGAFRRGGRGRDGENRRGGRIGLQGNGRAVAHDSTPAGSNVNSTSESKATSSFDVAAASNNQIVTEVYAARQRLADLDRELYSREMDRPPSALKRVKFN